MTSPTLGQATTFPLTAARREIMVMLPGTVQAKAFTDTAAAVDNAINGQIVRVWATTDCHVVFGSSPTATTSDTPLAAKAAEYFVVPEPGVSKLSAVQQSANGTIYVTECL